MSCDKAAARCWARDVVLAVRAIKGRLQKQGLRVAPTAAEALAGAAVTAAAAGVQLVAVGEGAAALPEAIVSPAEVTQTLTALSRVALLAAKDPAMAPAHLRTRERVQRPSKRKSAYTSVSSAEALVDSPTFDSANKAHCELVTATLLAGPWAQEG